MAGPLSDIKVLELANFISGPYAAMLLADMGAEVIKAELPGTGDPYRVWVNRPGVRPQFAAFNRGKRSVTMNLQTEGGRELCRRLASQVDVVIENFRPGTLDRMGLSYQALAALNPRLVYCSMTGMGSSGPYKHRPTYDAIAQAMSGLWSVFTDLKKPEPVGPPLADQVTGLFAANSILGALVRRGVTGRGQKVDLSMLSAAIAFLAEAFAAHLMTGEMDDRYSRPRRSQSYAFVAADGRPLAVHLSQPPKFWIGLANSVGRPELVDDPRFKTKDDRVRNYWVLAETLGETFATKPRAEWLAILEQHDVPCAPINDVSEVVDDPQVQHLGLIRTYGQGERALRLAGYPAEFTDSPCDADLPPPDLGEHTEQVYRELGCSDEQLAALRSEGAI